MTFLGVDFKALPPTPQSFQSHIEQAMDSRVQAMWVLADALVFSEDNPDYADTFEQYFDDAKVSRRSIEKHRATIRTFPHARRKWNLSIEMYYTVKTLDNEAGQNRLLEQVATEDINDKRGWLRDEVKRIKNEPITTTTTLDLPVIELDGKRYIVADDIPETVNIVQVKFAREVESEIAA